MPTCFNISNPKSPQTQSPLSQQPNTPRSNTSTQPSPTLNLSREYTLAVQTHSYEEIWAHIHPPAQAPNIGTANNNNNNIGSSSHILGEVLQPDRASVMDALKDSKPNNLTRLVSAYFDNSEETSHLCLMLHRSVDNARSLYKSIHDLLEVLHEDAQLIGPQCDRVLDIFNEFDVSSNPFPDPGSDNFERMRACFAELKEKLNSHLRKAKRKVLCRSRAVMGGAVCLIGTTATLVVSAVVIATHALVVLVAGSVFTFVPLGCGCELFKERYLDHVAQLDAAAKGTYVLNNDLDTIDKLVERLYTAVESDKVLIRLGLGRGKDRYLIQEVLKQLRKNRMSFDHQLKDLEEHVCLCFATINRTRSLLLKEVHMHQTHGE